MRRGRGAGWFWNMPLNGKIAVIFLGGISIPFFVISILVFQGIYRNAMESENQMLNRNLENVVSGVEGMLMDYEMTAEGVYDYEEFLKSAAAAEEPQAEQLNRDSSVNLMLSNIRRSREFMAGASFVFPDGSIVSQVSGYGRYEETVRETEGQMEELLAQMEGRVPGEVWQASVVGQKDANGRAAYFSGRRIIRNIYNRNQLVGIVILHISTLALDHLAVLDQEEDQGLLVILDGSNHLLWSNGDAEPVLALLSEYAQREGGKQELPGHRGQLEEYGNHYYICQESAYSGWRFIHMVPRGEVERQANMFLLFLALILCLIICFSVLCMALVHRFIVYPVRKLIVVMDEVDDLEKIHMQLPVGRKDEIGLLYGTYNRLNQRISGLVLQLTETLRQDKEKEIRLLHSQLNPHFIYNTLESISWIAYEKQLPEVSRVVAGLSEILKYSIKFSDAYVTFGNELEMLENYISIQRFRFEDRFLAVYDIDETLLNYKTVKFMFQPFVENALIHGFKQKEKDCRVTIRLYDQGEDIAAEIEDNGCGMEEVMVEQALSRYTKGIGIGNLNRSLQLRFGERYQIQIDSRPGRGTRIRLRIPKIP
ncbi:MAG: sensor histidine kinase [Lachnospiraceae bacterium]|nr:sensor histidine kinase [Lachnospiraceae bacterium]